MAAPELTATIIANGVELQNWERVECYRRIGDLTSHFRVRVAEIPANTSPPAGWPSQRLGPNNPASCSLAGILVVSGVVTIRQVALTATSHAVDITVNGKTFNLLNSMPLETMSGQFKNATAQQIINAITGPYGIGFSYANTPGGANIPIERFSIHTGETSKQTIERLGRMRNIHFSDVPGGDLVGYSGSGGPPPATAGLAIVEGQNIREIHGIMSIPDMANQIVMTTQSFGNDMINGDAARAIGALVNYQNPFSPTIPLRVMGETDNQQGLLQQANNEAQMSLGTVEEIFVTVPGWLCPDGSLWIQHLGELISITSPSMFPDTTETLSLRGVTHKQSNEEGTTTLLEFCLFNALYTGGQINLAGDWPPTPEPAVPYAEPDSGGGGGGG